MEHYYALLNQHIREAFEAEYVDSNGKIDNDVQGLYVMALAMHMVSEKKRPLLAKQLDRLIQDNHGCLDTGFMNRLDKHTTIPFPAVRCRQAFSQAEDCPYPMCMVCPGGICLLQD